jgi:hypothetical protein
MSPNENQALVSPNNTTTTTPIILEPTLTSSDLINNETHIEFVPTISSDIADDSKPTDSSTTMMTSIGEPVEFLKCIDKLLASTHTVDKHLDNVQKTNKEFYEFEKQNLKLNAIKQTLESLALALKTLLLHKKAILEKSNAETSKKIAKLIANLTKQHQSVVKKFKEKTETYTKNNDKYNEFLKDYDEINAWLDVTLSKVNDLKIKTLDNTKLVEIVKVIPIKIFIS